MSAISLMPRVDRHTPSHSSDAETMLMERVHHDVPGAFAELVERCRDRTFARLFRSLRDRQEAEDLTQEVFLRLFRARKRWEPRAKFATWLFHITQNVTRNALRARRRRLWLHVGGVPDVEQPNLDQPSGDDRPSAPMERRELAQALRWAVDGLGGRQRAAFEMQQYQDRSYAEIARAMALTPKAAKSLLYRARLQLRDRLNGYMHVD
jgi:RNA polymerase sigma-70 factor (ECF subfamily)